MSVAGARALALALLALPGLATALPAAAQEGFDIAITVDDLPAHSNLPPGTSRVDIARAYVAALKAHKVGEAFGFVNAGRIADEPDSEKVLKLWVEAGYPLGNHTRSHMNLNSAPSLAAWTADVEAVEPVIARYMAGKDWHYFRYPNLSAGNAERGAPALQFLKGRGYRVAHVSVAFSDWSYSKAYVRCLAQGDTASIAAMKAEYLQGVDAGIVRMKAVSRRLYGRVVPQVLLTHVGAWSAATLPDVLVRLDAAGARYVPLARAQADQAYIEAERIPGGGSIMERAAKARGVALSDIPKPRMTLDLRKICPGSAASEQ